MRDDTLIAILATALAVAGLLNAWMLVLLHRMADEVKIALDGWKSSADCAVTASKIAVAAVESCRAPRIISPEPEPDNLGSSAIRSTPGAEW